jgi:ribosome recycling factor
MYEKLTNEYKQRMEKTVFTLIEEFVTIRAGRANPTVLNKISVEYYGVPTPISQVANISVQEARILVIQPWDVKLLKEVEKAIHKSDIGINPSSDGRVIRLVFPQLTEERRKELTKKVRKYGEEAKVVIRNIRREALDKFKKMEKSSDITEDDYKDIETEIQKLTDEYIANIDEAVKEKEDELLEV